MGQKSGIGSITASTSITFNSTFPGLIVQSSSDFSLRGKTDRIVISTIGTFEEECRVKIVLDETSVGSTENIGCIDMVLVGKESCCTGC